MSKVVMRRAIAIGVAALFVLIGAASMAEAGRGGSGFKGGGGGFKGAHMGGGAKFHGGGGGGAKFHTNQGGKFAYRGGGGGAKFHTNPGGKYVYRGSGSKFHTNPGGKNVYRGWSGKYDKYHNYGHYRRYGAWYGLPLYSYGGGCAYFYQRAIATGSAYWWDRYRRCSGPY
jgi:hypothetical protein